MAARANSLTVLSSSSSSRVSSSNSSAALIGSNRTICDNSSSFLSQQFNSNSSSNLNLSSAQSMETCFSSFDRDGLCVIQKSRGSHIAAKESALTCYPGIVTLLSYPGINSLMVACVLFRDGFLNYAEFVVLCRALFRNQRDKPYQVEPKKLREMFDTFDINKDALIDINEFELCWQKWIRKEDDQVLYFQSNNISAGVPHTMLPSGGKGRLERAATCTIHRSYLHHHDILTVIIAKFCNVYKTLFKIRIVRPISCLVVVDVQNDFISGSLAISNCPAKHNGEEVVEPINRLLDTVEFDCVYYTLDWHPDTHVSFYDNVHLRKLHHSSLVKTAEEAKLFDTVIFDGSPPMEQRLWPRHCVQNSWGAKIHENIKIVEGSPFIYKGTNPEVDSYSAFFDNKKVSKTTLDLELTNKGVSDVFVCGIAYDVCVGATALHAIELGYRTVLIDDACRGITIDDIMSTKNKVEEGHGAVVQTHEVKAMVQGRDRRPELGYKLALELRKQIKQLEQENRM